MENLLIIKPLNNKAGPRVGEITGNTTNPTGFMRLDYSNGWGQTKYVLRLKNEVNGFVKGAYMFNICLDNGSSNKFEVTVYPTFEAMASSTGGTVIHSKKKTGLLPLSSK